jgi:hypothetical protein
VVNNKADAVRFVEFNQTGLAEMNPEKALNSGDKAD